MSKTLTILLLITTIVACQKNRMEIQAPISLSSSENQFKTFFGQTLAKALQQEPQLRAFIRQESLKEFDNDNDVFYQAVKNEKIDGEKTFYDLLAVHSASKEKLDECIKALPLLTIFVPTLPNFNPEKWNAENDVPRVAIEPDETDKKVQTVAIYDAKGEKIDLGFHMIPGFPILVIKNNERVSIDGSELDFSRQFVNGKEERVHYKNIDGKNFSFNAKVYDNFHTPKFRTGLNNTVTGRYTIDPINIDAYNSGTEWPRDFVYYGIDPTHPVGVYRNTYHEFVRSFKFLNANDLNVVSDESFDPKPVISSFSPPSWTEGSYEFQMDIIMNSKNGTGSMMRKSFICRGSDLFSIQYTQRLIFGSIPIYTVTGYQTLNFDPNLDLIPWDLMNYGMAWKFLVNEFDVSATITTSVTHTSVQAFNFELSDSFFKKVGAKFGGALTTTNTTVNTYSYTVGSDMLGEGILGFDYKIITSLANLPPTPGIPFNQIYNTYDVTTGRVAFSVEPKTP